MSYPHGLPIELLSEGVMKTYPDKGLINLYGHRGVIELYVVAEYDDISTDLLGPLIDVRIHFNNIYSILLNNIFLIIIISIINLYIYIYNIYMYVMCEKVIKCIYSLHPHSFWLFLIFFLFMTSLQSLGLDSTSSLYQRLLFLFTGDVLHGEDHKGNNTDYDSFTINPDDISIKSNL